MTGQNQKVAELISGLNLKIKGVFNTLDCGYGSLLLSKGDNTFLQN